MTKDTNDSVSVYEAVGRKWKMLRTEPQGFRAKIWEFLKDLEAIEFKREYTDLAAYRFYVVPDLPKVEEKQ